MGYNQEVSYSQEVGYKLGECNQEVGYNQEEYKQEEYNWEECNQGQYNQGECKQEVCCKQGECNCRKRSWVGCMKELGSCFDMALKELGKEQCKCCQGNWVCLDMAVNCNRCFGNYWLKLGTIPIESRLK